MAPTPIGLMPPSVGLLAASVAIETATVAVISSARTVPALTLSAAEAALVEARTIPAIHVKAERDVLDRSKRFDCEIGTERRAQWQRLGAAWHESACSKYGHPGSKSRKNMVHDIDPLWIETFES